MPTQMNEQKVLDYLDKLSPQGKRKALRKLISDLDDLERMVERNQRKLEKIAEERGLDFSAMSEEEREELIDQILHED